MEKYRTGIAAAFPLVDSGTRMFGVYVDNRREHSGFQYGVNAAFTDGSNYKRRFAEYLDNPKRGRIAAAGHELAILNLNTGKAVTDLVGLLRRYGWGQFPAPSFGPLCKDPALG